MKTRFNYWGPHSVRRAAALTPGVLGRRAIEVFTRGQCHSFALALQRLTGWGLIGMYHDRGLTHLAVVEPLSGLAAAPGLGLVWSGAKIEGREEIAESQGA